jgi:polysaccharide deacetylase family protein (PEP-CTERM system associated)
VTGPAMCAMTVDVEDWYQVQAFAGVIPRSEWDGLDSRVEANTDRILAQFAEAGVTATFFTLGCVAERHGALVRRIVAGGHELASHGHAHQRADSQSPAEFRDDVERARAVLEDAGGVAVSGYRAPTFSIGPRNGWAWDVLREAGYRYSSSLYPVRHDLYGTPDACRFPYQPSARSDLWEIPMTAIRVRGQNLPCSGGGWFRMLPYPIFRLGLQHFTRQEQKPGVFYIHPWEIDPGQPDVPRAPWRSRFRHRVNLGRTERRLTRLLGDFRWNRMDRVFPQLQAA